MHQFVKSLVELPEGKSHKSDSKDAHVQLEIEETGGSVEI